VLLQAFFIYRSLISALAFGSASISGLTRWFGGGAYRGPLQPIV
jgi:hypothetical protein